jgi:glucuronoarabinoxylan endo-1,4-beta-xylanase
VGGTSQATAGRGGSSGGTSTSAIAGSSLGGNRDAGAGGAGDAGRGGTLAFGGTVAISTGTLACPSGTACADFSALQQEIDGFGAAAALTNGGTLSTTLLDAAFKNETLKQMGLSILRVDIPPEGQSAWASRKSNAQSAKSRGAKYVLATPWSPPASMKTNNNTTGGELKTASYADYAAWLKSYYTYMGGPGGAVDIISVQNEPNITVTYVSATWNATQLLNFTKNNAQDIGAPVMMPEAYNFDTALSDPSLNDATAAANISFIGLHLYGAKMKTYTLAIQKGKRLWMTEKYFDPEDINNMMSMGQEIMDCMNNYMNAYVWWYLSSPNCNLLTASGGFTNKGYVMAQFSKFIRPGFHRVATNYQPQTSVSVVAFTGSSNVIVAVNKGTAAKSQTFSLSGATVASFHQYTTSNSKKLSDDGTVAVTNNSFTVSLDPQSVTTFVAPGASP